MRPTLALRAADNPQIAPAIFGGFVLETPHRPDQRGHLLSLRIVYGEGHSAVIRIYT